MTSITYITFTDKHPSPYKVNNIIWDSRTKKAVFEFTVSGYYINSNKNKNGSITLENINRNPNHNYFMPKNCFSISKMGHIYPNREKLLSLSRATTDLSILTAISAAEQGYGDKTDQKPDREPYQWEYDKQSYKDDLWKSDKSINALVWMNIDNYIIILSC
jgi:hypothetical protein